MVETKAMLQTMKIKKSNWRPERTKQPQFSLYNLVNMFSFLFMPNPGSNGQYLEAAQGSWNSLDYQLLPTTITTTLMKSLSLNCKIFLNLHLCTELANIQDAVCFNYLLNSFKITAILQQFLRPYYLEEIVINIYFFVSSRKQSSTV